MEAWLGYTAYSLFLLFLQLGILASTSLFVFLYVYLKFTTTREPDLSRADSEKSFTDPSSNSTKPFPSIGDAPSLYLSLVIPAYKEEKRLPKMMDETIAYLEDRKKKDKSFTYEIIIVNDGSTDRTDEVAMKYVSKYGSDKIRLLNFVRNRGKGGAVRMGCLSARGERILFADADGATDITATLDLEKKLDLLASSYNVPAISIGSRAHLQDEAVANRCGHTIPHVPMPSSNEKEIVKRILKLFHENILPRNKLRSFFRNLLMYGFHMIVYVLCVRGIRDTQCGFKMCTRSAVRDVFSNLHIERWAFDVEMLYIAQYLNIPIEEVAVNWEEIEGSKIVPVFSWLQMGRDILFIRLRYMFGFWSIKTKIV